MKKYTLILSLIFTFFISCKKEWLDVKPDKALAIPQTIEDYQSLLDNSNTVFNSFQPALGEIASGDFYIRTNDFQSLGTATERNCYIWAQDGSYVGGNLDDWNRSYTQIHHANVVLDGIQEINPGTSDMINWNNVQGSALFYRSFALFNIAQVFCKPYIKLSASTDLGLPIKLSADINEQSNRSSVQETYDQIISDLLIAKNLLPILPLYKTRPSKPAVFALLSRVYLSMQDYDKCLQYSDSCLQLQNSLMDYNIDPEVHPNSFYPFSGLNSEVIFQSSCLNYGIFSTARLIVDSSLYKLYDSSDIRRKLFFTNSAGKVRFRGSYNGNRLFFGGLAVDEVYLNRSEANARLNNTTAALSDLDSLRKKRITSGYFMPSSAGSANVALQLILDERRRELCFRTLRWSDLRRLNQDVQFQMILTRMIDNQVYTLQPNDKRYVFPIPNQEILLSGIPQNPY